MLEQKFDDAGRGFATALIVPVNSTIEASGSGALILSGLTNAATAARTITLTGSNTDANEVSSVLADTVGTAVNPLTVTKSGGGAWILSNPGNNYSGNTNITSGLLGEQYIWLDAGGDSANLAHVDSLKLTQSAVVLEKLISQFLYSKAAEGDTTKK